MFSFNFLEKIDFACNVILNVFKYYIKLLSN